MGEEGGVVRFWGLGVGCRVWGVGCGVWVMGCGVLGVGYMDWGSRFGVLGLVRYPGGLSSVMVMFATRHVSTCRRVQGLGFGV